MNSQRAHCHWLIDRIPEEGLDELVELLYDLYSFYQNRDISAHITPEISRTKAVVHKTIVRPPFEIGLEENDLEQDAL